MENIQHALKPDAQGFDEVRITTVPRYKTSGLSGNEWRISGVCQLLRKGKVIHEFGMADVKNCAYALPYHIMKAGDDGLFFFGGGEDGKCDQEGCADVATVFYRLKNKYCSEAWSHPAMEQKNIVVRQFCERHSTRGDCGMEDADANYEVIDGSIVPPRQTDESPSVFGGVITLGGSNPVDPEASHN